jgi:DNA polymerase-3 subunit delta
LPDTQKGLKADHSMMIKPEQLQSKLAQNTLPMIWISGDETLLVQECCDQVRTFARQQGFREREVMDSGPGFDWTTLLAAGNAMSLFAERKLIDLRMPGQKPDDKAREALQAYLESPSPDNLLLLTTGRLDKASQSTKWFRQLEANALFCQVWPVSEQQLPGWIRQRLQQHGLQIAPDALQILVERVEGNLLAAAQEIEKLLVLADDDKLDTGTVLDIVADNARFTIYSLVDACLAGNPGKACHILNHLRGEGTEALHILAVINGQIRGLAAMQHDLAQGHHINGVLQTHRVWSNRTAMVTSALKRHDAASLQGLLKKAMRIDQSVKKLLRQDPWEELSDLVLKFSDPRLLVGVI